MRHSRDTKITVRDSGPGRMMTGNGTEEFSSAKAARPANQIPANQIPKRPAFKGTIVKDEIRNLARKKV